MKNIKKLRKKKSQINLELENIKIDKKNVEMKEEIFNYYNEDEQNKENFGSKSWQIYVNQTCPELFQKFLNVTDFTSNDDKNKEKLYKKQESNKKLSELFTESYIELKQSNNTLQLINNPPNFKEWLEEKDILNTKMSDISEKINNSTIMSNIEDTKTKISLQKNKIELTNQDLEKKQQVLEKININQQTEEFESLSNKIFQKKIKIIVK